jgi:hypothetical protein
MSYGFVVVQSDWCAETALESPGAKSGRASGGRGNKRSQKKARSAGHSELASQSFEGMKVRAVSLRMIRSEERGITSATRKSGQWIRQRNS